MVVSKVKKLVLTRPNKRECVRFVASFFLHHAQRAPRCLEEKEILKNYLSKMKQIPCKHYNNGRSIWNELLLFTRIGRERWWREESDNFGRRITYFDADFGGLSGNVSRKRERA